MLETPESFNYVIQRKNVEDWAISRQLLTKFLELSGNYDSECCVMKDNPNKKGTLGEIAVCKELLKLGFEVFLEVGNHSKVDLVVLDENYVCYKIQIKATYSKNEIIEVYSTKSCLNPKYNSTYEIEQVDVFAVYVINKDIVFYISAKEVLKNSKSSKFKLTPSKNRQQLNVRYVDDYLDFKKALRDLTPHTQTVHTAGDEKVQTTTLIISG